MSDEKNFYISKNEISRLKTFSNFIKKLEVISPLDQTQLFVVKSNKLTIYGYGNGTLGSGHIQSTFDLVADENHTNPKIISYSDEMIAAEAGEGCLSVNREVEGHIKRYARVRIEGYDLEGNKIMIRAREELAIAFQHEIDHLNGILFYDRIDPNHKFYKDYELRLI